MGFHPQDGKGVGLEILESILHRLRLLVGRCVVSATRYEADGLVADTELLVGEKRRSLEIFGLYGFSSRPKGDASGVALFVGGSRDNGVVVATRGDGKEMSVELSPGEVLVHSPFGQKILLDKDGNVKISVAAGKRILYTAETFEISGDLEVGGEVSAKCKNPPGKVSLSTHLHPTATGPTSAPTGGT